MAIDIYDSYKPFRNFLTQFELVGSLEVIWLYSQHLARKRPLPNGGFRGPAGFPIRLEKNIFPWDLDVLSREIILNAGNVGRSNLGNWDDLAVAINHLRRLDDEISVRRNREGYDVLRDMHRIVHRQFPWQRPPNSNGMMRYSKIFGGSGLEALVATATGLSLRQLYLLGMASAGHFMNRPGMRIDSDYSVLGVDQRQSQSFFERLTIDVKDLRRRAKDEQKYDEDWMYTFNPLRAHPLVRFDAAHPERVLCPIPEFLMRRVSEGVFYDIASSAGFSNSFGVSFQKYVAEVAYALCPSPKFQITDEKEYKVGKYRKDGVDLIIEDESGVIFVECKTKRLRQDAKFSASGDGLEQAMDDMAKYVVQHYKNISDAVAGLTSWKARSAACFPIIVTLEDWWIFGPTVVELLADRVEDRFNAAHLPQDLLHTMPYTIASIDEFEIALQIMDQVGIKLFLSTKNDSEHRTWSVRPFATNHFPVEAAKVKRNLFEDEWRQLIPSASQ